MVVEAVRFGSALTPVDPRLMVPWLMVHPFMSLSSCGCACLLSASRSTFRVSVKRVHRNACVLDVPTFHSHGVTIGLAGQHRKQPTNIRGTAFPIPGADNMDTVFSIWGGLLGWWALVRLVNQGQFPE